MPVRVGAVTLVIESVDDAPLSLAATRTGADGAPGATRSMRTRTDSVLLWLPGLSSAENATVWTPSPATVTAAVSLITVTGVWPSTA